MADFEDPSFDATGRLRRVRIVLGAVLLGLVVHLLVGEKPWDAEVPGRFEPVEPGRLFDVLGCYRYWISAGNAVLVALLWWWAPRWLGPREAPVDPSLAAPASRSRAFAWLVAGAVALAAILAWPRLEFGFWDDEISTVFYFADGGYVSDRKGGAVAWQPSWRRTFHYGTKKSYGANNHVPHTILVRLTLGAWRAVAQPEVRWPDERVARIPAFLAGLGAIVATALLLRRLGFPVAGVFVAWLLAIHPWYLRYVSEARGYSLLMLLVPLLLYALLDAFERSSWRRWLAFAGAGAAVLWTFPGALLVVVAANLTALAELARRRQQAGVAVRASRWLVANLLAAGVWAQLMLPNLLLFALHISWEVQEPHRSLVYDLLSHVWSGTAWAYPRSGDHYAELADFAGAWPGPFQGLVAAAVGLALLGAVRLLRRGRLHAWLVAVLALPAPLAVAVQMWRHALFHPWYAIYAVPGLAILLAIGLETVFVRLRAPRARMLATAGGMAAFWLGYAATSHFALRALRTSPVMQTREVAAVMRPVRDPFDPANERVLTASWRRAFLYYDPLSRRLSEPGELRSLMDQADAMGQELFVTFQDPWATGRKRRELTDIVRDETRFAEVAQFYGFEPRGHWIVYRYLRRTPAGR